MSTRISSEATYTDQIFRLAQLDLAELVNSEFYDCSFENCSLVETTVRNCRFVNCLFEQCDLSLVQLPGTRFSATRFAESRLVGVNWTLADWETTKLGTPIGFRDCTINYATFIGLSLPRIEITGCSAVDVDFRDADLSRATFAGTDLAQSLFGNTDLTEADLSQARNYEINPGQNIVQRARFAMPEAMSLLYHLDIILVDQER
jgi:fluoroquinolone resistance protein